jgi:hypothetical protein
MSTLNVLVGATPPVSPSLLLLITAIGTPLVALGAAVWSNINTGRQLHLTRETVNDQLALAASTSAAQIAASREDLDRQIKANVISTNRQRWIDLLRDDVAEFLQCHAICRDMADGIDLSLEERKAGRQANERRALLFQRIRLRLNPKETPHNDLVTDLESLVRSNIPALSDPAFERVIKLTQPILKAEWNRVKNLEMTGNDTPPEKDL